MNSDAARELGKKVDEVQESLSKGESGKAADKLADLRKKLADLRQDGKVTAAAVTALRQPLDQAVALLTSTDDAPPRSW